MELAYLEQFEAERLELGWHALQRRPVQSPTPPARRRPGTIRNTGGGYRGMRAGESVLLARRTTASLQGMLSRTTRSL
jgi:hypothetical protein